MSPMDHSGSPADISAIVARIRGAREKVGPNGAVMSMPTAPFPPRPSFSSPAPCSLTTCCSSKSPWCRVTSRCASV